MSVEQLVPVVVVGGIPTNAPVGYVGGGYATHGALSPADISVVISHVIREKEIYYQNHEDEESIHYRDPASSHGITSTLVSSVVTESSKLLGHIADLQKANLTESAFKVMKAASFKNNLLMQGVFSWSSVRDDAGSGTPQSVAVGTELVMLAGQAALTAAIFTLMGSPVGMAGILGAAVIGTGVSLMADQFGFRGEARALVEYVLGNIGLRQNGADLFQGADMRGSMEGLQSADDIAYFSDYEVFRVMQEIGNNPEDYSLQEAILQEVLESISALMLAQEIDFAEGNDLGLENRPLPVVVDFRTLGLQNGEKSFSGEQGQSYLLIGDESASHMVGGTGINWFMPLHDKVIAKTVVGNPDGFNILDFSMSRIPVETIFWGNVRVDRVVEEKGWNTTTSLLRENIFQKLRGDLFWELGASHSDAAIGMEQYETIDFVIGSGFDDVFVGDIMGGMVFTGGAGQDYFVVNGGSNRIVFRDGDFLSPDSEGITTKFVHGMTTVGEAAAFNAMAYTPSGWGGGSSFRLNPDVLDFSDLDADLTQEGHQGFQFIGMEGFGGVAGQIRYVTEVVGEIVFLAESHNQEYRSVTYALEGDRTGDGVADFLIEVAVYTNPSLGVPGIGQIYTALGAENFLF